MWLAIQMQVFYICETIAWGFMSNGVYSGAQNTFLCWLLSGHKKIYQVSYKVGYFSDFFLNEKILEKICE